MKPKIKLIVAKKYEGKPVPARVKKLQKAGPIEHFEVEGQANWILVQCPWCGGMSWRLEGADYDPFICPWCGSIDIF